MEIKNIDEKEKILYLNREINRQNILIKQLQKRISNLIDEKNFSLMKLIFLKMKLILYQ